MTPDEQARLDAAERVCILFGWGTGDDSEVSKATHEAWVEWLHISGVDTSPQAHPDLDAMVPTLAAMRDATRDHTLRQIRERGYGSVSSNDMLDDDP